jgi:CHASE2 domain-containing sensor protein
MTSRSSPPRKPATLLRSAAGSAAAVAATSPPRCPFPNSPAPPPSPPSALASSTLDLPSSPPRRRHGLEVRPRSTSLVSGGVQQPTARHAVHRHNASLEVPSDVPAKALQIGNEDHCVVILQSSTFHHHLAPQTRVNPSSTAWSCAPSSSASSSI